MVHRHTGNHTVAKQALSTLNKERKTLIKTSNASYDMKIATQPKDNCKAFF